MPLYGKELLFGVVALFAAGHDVALGAFSPAGNRYDMVHGELFGRCWTVAIVADTPCQATFPPLGFAQLPGAVAFPF